MTGAVVWMLDMYDVPFQLLYTIVTWAEIGSNMSTKDLSTIYERAGRVEGRPKLSWLAMWPKMAWNP